MERVTFLFDPRSPWCYQTSRWVRRLEALGELSLGWGVFSLEVVNLAADEDPTSYDAEYGPALRIAVALRASHGEQAVGDFYRELGALMWERPAPSGEPVPPLVDLCAQALAAIGIDPGHADAVLSDPATRPAVLAEHQGWVERLRAFGVPTLVLAQGGAEVAVFGPVLRALPDEEGCVELWRHVRGIVANGHIYELRKTKPLSLRADLPAAGGGHAGGAGAHGPGAAHTSTPVWSGLWARCAPHERAGQRGEPPGRGALSGFPRARRSVSRSTSPHHHGRVETPVTHPGCPLWCRGCGNSAVLCGHDGYAVA